MLKAHHPPHKKARQLPVENREMLQLIQTTISNSIEGHLGRIESSLATLVQDQSTQASRTDKTRIHRRGSTNIP